MTDLTEQLKKGELPEGHYYVKDGENIIAELLDGYFYNDGQPMTSFTGGVDEVLAPVPSYEDWKEKLEENAKLKKQLNETKSVITSALNFLSCADRISDTECNEQLAFDVLRKALEELEK